MKSLSSIALLSTAALTLTVAGCAGDETVQGDDVVAPEFEAGQGQDPAPEIADTPSYPGPFSNDVGGIIRNYQFRGYADFGSDARVSDIKLSHFYNPDWNGSFAEGSQYGAGTPKPKAIVLMMSSVWCAPCNLEAATVLPEELPNYQPDVMFVGALIDGQQGGVPATYKDLTNWVSQYQTTVSYPMVIDPTEQITPIMEPAYPSNMIIDTRTMQIMFMDAGAVAREYESGVVFWAALDDILADNYVAGQTGGQF